ncbi:hypothetical protein BaRGS_00013101, partial [Batillaria attramentaria]
MALSMRVLVPGLVLAVLNGCTAKKPDPLEELEKRVIAQDTKLQRLDELEERVLQQDIKLQRQEQEIQDQKETILKLDSELQQLKTKEHTPVVSQISSQVTQMNAEIQTLKTVNQQQDEKFGTPYVRWGHGACPHTSDIVYS